METEVHYIGKPDRRLKVAVEEAKGLSMVYDNFDPDWKAGQVIRGLMGFNDLPSPENPLPVMPTFTLNPADLTVLDRVTTIELFLLNRFGNGV